MSRKISDMRNLGPKMERKLAEIEIFSEEDLREIGSVTAWRRLRFLFGNRVSLSALYAMYASLQDRSWLDVTKVEKAKLKRSARQQKPPI